MRTAEEMELEKLGPTLAAALNHTRHGTTSVLDAGHEIRPDSEGEPAVFVTVVLPDPPEPTRAQRCWPREDLRSLRQAFVDAPRSSGSRESAYLYLTRSPALGSTSDDG